MLKKVLPAAAVLLFGTLFGFALFASDASVQMIGDLREGAALSEKRGVPILLMIAADHCPYCTLVEEEVMEPMLLSGDYVNKAVIRKLDLDIQGDVIDFDGSKIYSRDFAERYDVDVTPTMLFLDGRGRQVVKRMVGVTTIDYYGFYLDEAIDNALGKMRKGE